MNDPKVVLRNLINNEWDSNLTSYSNDPRIHTGWYDRNSGGPQITITNTDETTLGGGNVGISSINNDNGITQNRVGTVLVNCWSGTREELTAGGFANEDLNPKKVAFELKEQSKDIIEDHHNGIINGNQEFLTLGIPAIREVPETDDEFMLRFEIRTAYTYVE